MSLFIAIAVILEAFTIKVSESLMISLGFIVFAICGYMFGPISTGIVAALADVIGVLLFPKGAFFPGFTLTAFLGGMVYGSLLYKCDITSKKNLITRLSISKISVNLILNTVLNTFWLSIIIGKSVLVLLGPRIIKNIVLLPIEIFILYIVFIGIVPVINRMIANKKER